MKPSYSVHDPKGWCGDPRRGAALGRPTVHDKPHDYTGRIYMSRVYLDNGGYDKNGTYFGHGEPLYWYATDDGEIDGMLRARSRDAAWLQVRCWYPSAKVRR
jgi:hypothetical protein